MITWDLTIDGDLLQQRVRDPQGRDVMRTDVTLSTMIAACLTGRYGEYRFHTHGNLSSAPQVTALSGEQTNATAITGDAMWKFFRTSPRGAHPDVALPSACTRHVAEVLGYVTYQDFTIAAVTRRIAGAQDAWRTVTEQPERVVAAAGNIGAALAHLHGELAQAFGTTTLDLQAKARADLDAFVQSTGGRQGLLAPYAAKVEEAINALSSKSLAQRIHGDLHLGQVLLAETQEGVVFLDFEGEPGAPVGMASALYDLAGLVRSFHYAGLEAPEALCTAYGVPSDDPQLKAMIALRFAYEVSYEARHRPNWVQVPLDTARFVF